MRIGMAGFRPWQVLIVVVATSLLGACTTNQLSVPGTGVSVPIPQLPIPGLPLLGRGEGDLRHLTWSRAFLAMHERMSREYPFTEHKGIDWEMLRDTYHPIIQRAEERRDSHRYYIALREFLYELPDAHVGMSFEEEYRDADIAGGYGFGIRGLDDGRVIVHLLLDDGPAKMAGLEWGAEILMWDNDPIAEALMEAPVIWAEYPAATPYARQVIQERLRVRAPVDTAAEIVYRNPGSDEISTMLLSAYDDDYATWQATVPEAQDLDLLDSPLRHEMVAPGIGYIQVLALAPTLRTPFFDRACASAAKNLIEGDAQAIIIDLRSNLGGVSTLAAQAAGHFTDTVSHYEDMAYYNSESGSFEIAPDERIEIRPRAPQFRGPLIVLVDAYTADAGEGLAAALVRLAGAEVMGYSGTAASFSNSGGGVTLPRGYTVFYPVGRSLDGEGNIQIESNAAGVGGVQPTHRLVFDETAARAIYLEGRDLLLEAAIAELTERL